MVIRKAIYNNILITFILLCLFIIPLSCIATQDKKHDTYGGTPSEVVKAFIDEGLKVEISDDEMRLCMEFLRSQYKYLPDDEDIRLNEISHVLDLGEPWGPCLNKYHIVTGFEIKEENVDKNKAEVKVIYKRLGWIWNKPQYLKNCYSLDTKTNVFENSVHMSSNNRNKIADKKKALLLDNNVCRFLYITNDTHEIIYHLVRPGNRWRISDCYEPHISINSAIKFLECTIKRNSSVSRTYPSAKQTIEIKKNIEQLKKYLD